MQTPMAILTALALALNLPAAPAAIQVPNVQAVQAQIQQSINSAIAQAQAMSSNFLPGAAQPVQMTPQQRELVDETNRYRISHGRAPLQPTAYLNGLAQDWANTMARTGVYIHNPSFDSRSFRARSENILKMTGPYSSQRAVNAWANSPGHNANMLDPRVTEIGVGIATAPNGETYAVQNFY